MKIISHNSYARKFSIQRKFNLMIILVVVLSSSVFIFNSNNITEINGDSDSLSKNPSLADIDSVLFEGNEKGLNITDYGNLYNYDQEVEVNNQESSNITYYLDDIHDWEANQIDNLIYNIQDTRNWVNNSGFKSPTIYREYQIATTAPSYSPNHPTSNIVHTITDVNNPTYMRAHFVDIEFERFYDYFYILDKNDQNQLITDTESRTNVYSPWIPGDTMKFTYRSDNVDEYNGYYMDYYEYINASSNYDINSDTWGFNYAENGVSGTNIYGAGECGNATGMYVGLYGEYNDYYQFGYTNGAFSELYQNISIPRGFVKDAYISFDYNVPFGYRTNNNYLYCKINNKKVYSKGMGDIIDAGKNKWYSTGKIYMDLWANTSQIFEGLLSDQNFNISVGIMCGNSVTVSYFEEAYQNIVWFDNISFVLTASANSTQSDINLKLNGLDLTDGNDWGISQKNITDTWETNPIILNFSTTSPDLSFNLDTTIYGNHKTQSKVGQTTLEGLSYEILENGTIIWEFSHNFYMPAQYSDFEFTIDKPANWNFISVLDPTLQSRSYELGGEGDLILHINKENALFPGWWTFRATSNNYLSISNTKLLKQGEWTHTSFTTEESTIIKTQVNYSNDIPANLGSTEVNLTIYDPDGQLWFTETQTPLSNGSVFFSEVYFDALNTTGGKYDYTLFWSNGTALGGLNSSFLMEHQSSFSLVKPNDAILDLITDAFVGDIIPVRVNLKDFENNDSISNAIISYNWTGGSTQNFTEAALGIYEAVLDTSDLGSNGFYEIFIESSKEGFLDYNLTLKINLGEETNLQRLQSDYNIELHANSTIKFRYYSLLDDEGIDGANVGVNISNLDLYSIENLPGGYYNIEFNTAFTDNLGINQLNFNFSAPSFEPQIHIYQFEIVEQSVNITAYVDNVEIQRNSIIEVIYMEEINISTQARALIDDNLLTGGNFTWKINTYEQTLNEYSNFWYNTSIQINPSIYSPGLNLIGIEFEMQKYKTEIFYIQLLVYEQPANLSVFINSQPILKNDIFEIMYMESITVSVKAFATIEADYINGALITWQGGNHENTLIESGSDWYNTSIQIIPANYTPGLNSIAIEFLKDNYQNEIFYFQLLVAEQSVNLSLHLNSHQISEDELVEAMFKQNITISARVYGIIDLNYVDEAELSWNSESYIMNFIEYGANWYNLSVTFSAINFTTGVNSVSIKFEKQNYTTTYFSFQLLIREQLVQLNVSVNSQPILENALIEVKFKEYITITAQAYAMGEAIFLSGGNITLIGETITFNIYENMSYLTWFSTDIIIDESYFDLGINTVSVRFKQDNYTDAYFSFQLFITAETVNLSLYVDSQKIVANSLIEFTYYDEFSLSVRALANVEKIFLDGGSVIFATGSYNQDFVQYANYWYNTSIIFDPLNFDLGINSVYIRFLHPNYTSSTFYFQILVNQIEMNVNTIDFQDSIETYSGESLVIRLNVTELVSANYIENTTVSYSWEFGLGNFDELGNGIYEIELVVPDNVQGSFKVSLIISTEDVLYKVKQSSFLVVVSQKELPDIIIWIVLIGLSILIGILGSLSLRSYVFLPRRRRREAELLARTQKFKDIQNIQAIVAIHKDSGIPLYTKSYSILEKHKKEIFSGFIQAIITVGGEMVGSKEEGGETTTLDKEDGSRTILELDFKYFYCLICDRQDLRIIFILTEKASDRLKTQISDLSLGAMLELSEQIGNWDGEIHEFEEKFPSIVNKYIELSYKESFTINNAEYIAKIRKESELNSMEIRILNVIYSIAKSKQEFHLETIFELIHEKNQNIVIDGIETLIKKQVIIPSTK